VKPRAPHRPLASERGYALPAVIGLALVMIILVTGSLTVTASGLSKANSDQDYSAALAAAYAGAEEYQSRLANDSTYTRYGNIASTFTKVPLSTVTLPAIANPAFNVGKNQSWATVPGSDGRAMFRYEVNNSSYGLNGQLQLRVTGRVDNATRSIVADVRQKGFLDFLYFTEYETVDPLVLGGNAECKAHAWDTPKRPDSCTTIQFAAGDVIDGPVHSNDQLVICSTKFLRAVTSSSTLPYKDACDTDPTFAVGTGVAYRSEITLPPTNSQMVKEGRNDLPVEVPRPGCLYTGPTTVTLLADGTMNVVSPWTKFTNVSMTDGILSKNPAECGDLTALNSAAGATIPTLDKNLMFVQNVPTTDTDPNYWASSSTPTAFTCKATGANSGWTVGTTTYPMAGESRPATSTSTSPAYGCRNGDAYVKGDFKGEMTIATENYIYVTGDIKYVKLESSMLGLVGQNAVWVYNPMTFGYRDNRTDDNSRINSATKLTIPGQTAKNRTIHAAILSVSHTFMVQNYQYGGAGGTLTVLGAIAQLFRGTVGQGDNGFLKSYTYDDRLKTAAPPKFLTPVSTTYGVSKFATVTAAFLADGAAAAP
jgi:hypothetical protein